MAFFDYGAAAELFPGRPINRAAVAWSAASSGSGTSITAMASIAALRTPTGLRENLTITRFPPWLSVRGTQMYPRAECVRRCTRHASRAIGSFAQTGRFDAIELQMVGVRSNHADSRALPTTVR